MNLQKKLEEIRRKPEHIRLRYTYLAVAVSMFFVLALWFFSISTTIKKTTVKKQNVFEGLNKEKKSIEEATNEVKKSLDDLNKSLKQTPADVNELPGENQEETPISPPKENEPNSTPSNE